MALPKDHWIHAAISKEKTRLKKKKTVKQQTGSPDAGASSVASYGAKMPVKPDAGLGC